MEPDQCARDLWTHAKDLFRDSMESRALYLTPNSQHCSKVISRSPPTINVRKRSQILCEMLGSLSPTDVSFSIRCAVSMNDSPTSPLSSPCKRPSRHSPMHAHHYFSPEIRNGNASKIAAGTALFNTSNSSAASPSPCNDPSCHDDRSNTTSSAMTKGATRGRKARMAKIVHLPHHDPRQHHKDHRYVSILVLRRAKDSIGPKHGVRPPTLVSSGHIRLCCPKHTTCSLLPSRSLQHLHHPRGIRSTLSLPWITSLTKHRVVGSWTRVQLLT